MHWPQVVAFGAIGWPWLLKSLYGGRRRDREALLARLDLPADALPPLGGWRSDAGFLRRLADHVLAYRPGAVVELGTGVSTLVMARAQQLWGGAPLLSFDHEPDFVREARSSLADHGLEADVRHAPLGPAPGGWPGQWYRLPRLPDRIDLLVIDGPPWVIHPLVRGAAETLFDRIMPGGTVILDDAARPGERLVAARWKRDRPDFSWHFEPGVKGTLIRVRWAPGR